MSKAPGLKRVSVKPGTRLFREGDPADNAFIVEDGKIEISKRVPGGEHVVISVLTRGALFGEMALIDAAPRGASARATCETTLMVIPRQEFERRLEKLDPFMKRVLTAFVSKLRNATAELANKTTIVR
ncbi:MAG: cyclic nucleotide-binding domain-containing protein [Magnetovibrionaceae bacterium]